jgi:hypothetical protein
LAIPNKKANFAHDIRTVQYPNQQKGGKEDVHIEDKATVSRRSATTVREERS